MDEALDILTRRFESALTQMRDARGAAATHREIANRHDAEADRLSEVADSCANAIEKIKGS